MTEHDRALDLELVEDGERVGDEVGGRVAVGGPPALPMTARVRRDELESARDRAGEEIPVATVVADAVQEQRRRSVSSPRPLDEPGTFA
jgi:hypothetical protein